MLSAASRDDDDVFELTRDALDDLPYGVITLDRDGTITRFNRVEEKMARRAARTTIGLDFFTDVAPCTNVRTFRGRFEEFTRHHDTGAETFDFAFAFSWGRREASITFLRKAGRPEINLLIGWRATDHISAVAKVERRQSALARPQRASFVAYGTAKEAPTVVRFGDAAEIALRCAIHPDDAVAVANVVANAARTRSPYSTEYRITRPDYSIGIVAETGFFPADLDEPGFATFVDVTGRRRSEEDSWHAAHFDPLTNLPNQRLFLGRISDFLSELRVGGERGAILVTNIDKFREINDMCGREVGNAMLKMFALRLGECVRAGDTVARLASDIFAVLLTDVGQRAHVEQTVDRLKAAIAEPFVIGDRSHALTVSIGISRVPTDGRDPDSLLRAGYTAMSAVKSSGKDGICWYSSEMSVHAAENARHRNELQSAVSNGELELYYQPIVDIELEQIVAVESLVRWNHPSRGLVLPGEFISLADTSGLIVPIGEWVLREACRQARSWWDSGFALRVCVNVSAVQFRQPNFVTLVAEILHETQLPPERLELELTESIMIDGFGAMMETLTALKAMGIRLAIDDFGTGYSSLAYLKHFPIDTLKIDRAFIVDLAAVEFDRAIVKAVMTLATALELDCVVEGVETQDQLDALRSIGCTSVQGYYFSRPVTAERLGQMLEAYDAPLRSLSATEQP